MVETVHATEMFSPLDCTGVQVDYIRRFKQSVTDSLVISLRFCTIRVENKTVSLIPFFCSLLIR